MIQVKVKIFSQPLPEILEFTVEDGTSIEALLRRIQQQAAVGRPEDASRKEAFLKTPAMLVVLMNGESIYALSGWKTTLRHGDEVSFLPMAAGG